MRSAFKGFQKPSDDDFAKLWEEGLFIFDTNALFDLYRIPQASSDTFIEYIAKVSDRIWVPHQVGIEFHRGRIDRIKEQRNAFDKLVQTLKSTESKIEQDVSRHRALDYDSVINIVGPSIEKAIQYVESVRNDIPDIDEEDPIALRLYDLLEGKVGEAPNSQDELDALYAEAEIRYTNKVPPGFQDGPAKGEEQYVFDDLVYKSKYSDYVLWRQSIDHVKNSDVKHVALVTRDRKEDWVQRVSGKRLGPLPELTREMLVKGEAETFWIYSPDAFVSNASKFMDKVSSAEVEAAVRELSSIIDSASTWSISRANDDPLGFRHYLAQATDAFRRNKWSAIPHPPPDDLSASPIYRPLWERYGPIALSPNAARADDEVYDLLLTAGDLQHAVDMYSALQADWQSLPKGVHSSLSPLLQDKLNQMLAEANGLYSFMNDIFLRIEGRGFPPQWSSILHGVVSELDSMREEIRSLLKRDS